MVLAEIQIGDQKVKMACSADTLRKYRIKFGRDLLQDMQKLSMDNLNTEFLEDLAYIMACQGDPTMDLGIDEWLDQFQPLEIVKSAQDILGLWNINMKSTSKPKKK